MIETQNISLYSSECRYRQIMTNKDYIKNLSPDFTTEEFARRLILKHFQTMISQIDGVIENKDPDPLHKFRVSGRRLRVVFKTFGNIFSKKESKQFFGVIKDLSPLTGKARDLDVNIIFLKNYIKTIPKIDRKVIQEYLDEKIEERDKLQPLLVDVLSSIRESSFIKDFNLFFRRMKVRLTIDEMSRLRVIKQEQA